MKTKEEIEAMSDEERQNKTRELLGWSCWNGILEYDGAKMPYTIWTKAGRDFNPKDVPDYLKSLDAMHEAEKLLVHPCENNKGKPDTYSYFNALEIVCETRSIHIVFATARQRNTAFLMVML